MAATIQAGTDTIKIGKSFVSGKDYVTVNGEVVFEGKLVAGQPHRIAVGEREFVVKTEVASKLTGALTYHLQIYDAPISAGGTMLHQGIYNPYGKQAASARQAKTPAVLQACGHVGAMIGSTTMVVANLATGVVPGGAIGGAIGGGGGAFIGYGIGTLIFGKPK